MLAPRERVGSLSGRARPCAGSSAYIGFFWGRWSFCAGIEGQQQRGLRLGKRRSMGFGDNEGEWGEIFAKYGNRFG